MAKLTFRKDYKSTVSFICIVILFALFSFMAMALLVVGANTYKGIKRNTDKTFNTAAITGYIQNKVHSYDNGNIDIVRLNEIDILVLYEESMEYKTFIYCYDNEVYEYLTKADAELNLGDGEIIFDAEKIELEKYGDFGLKISVKEKDEVLTSNYIAVQAGFLQ